MEQCISRRMILALVPIQIKNKMQKQSSQQLILLSNNNKEKMTLARLRLQRDRLQRDRLHRLHLEQNNSTCTANDPFTDDIL